MSRSGFSSIHRTTPSGQVSFIICWTKAVCVFLSLYITNLWLKCRLPTSIQGILQFVGVFFAFAVQDIWYDSKCLIYFNYNFKYEVQREMSVQVRQAIVRPEKKQNKPVSDREWEQKNPDWLNLKTINSLSSSATPKNASSTTKRDRSGRQDYSHGKTASQHQTKSRTLSGR